MKFSPGDRFGRLVLIEPGPITISKALSKTRTWVAKCDCGTQIVTRQGNLGRCTHSCGCLRQMLAQRATRSADGKFARG